MKFTFDWLKDHLRSDLNYQEIADILPNLGIEVEEVIDHSLRFQDFVVGFIRDTKPHPNADRLRVCEVDIGNEILNIVCGAQNARSGIYVAVARVGAVIPAHNERLRRSTIRGIDSEGMMCSTEELLIDDDGIDGIVELSQDSQIGGNIAQSLHMDDIIFDVSITPNRADCFSVRGLARDLAASGAGDLLPLPDLKASNSDEKNPINIDLQTPHCPYFSTVAVTGVSGHAPDYVTRRLKAIGQRLIHGPVDIGNYICIDIGQPMHIFDLDKLPPSLVVRDSISGEKLMTLNGEETVLPGGAVVIATADGKVLSIAGIMGGEDSACSDGSKNILVEGAYFDRIAIAKAGQALRLSTDARTRFERGIDPGLVEFAVNYAADLLTFDGAGKISNINEAGTLPPNTTTVVLNSSKFQALTGLDHDDFLKSKEIVERLGMKANIIDDFSMAIESPSWRHDISIEEDIIEEVVRIIGYDNIGDQELDKKDPISKVYTIDKISDALVYNGYHEVKTFSFIDSGSALLFKNREELLNIEDPLTIEFAVMRPSVVASHLKAIKLAQSKSQRNSRIFEVGKRYHKVGSNYEEISEENTVTATLSEDRMNRTWRYRRASVSIFDVKEDLEKLLNLTISGFRLSREAPGYYHPGRSGSYVIQKDTVIAHFGEIHQVILDELDITGPVACFELFLDHIPELVIFKQRAPLILSPYQSTVRDFSFIVKKDVMGEDIINAIKKLKLDWITSTTIFDVYESEAIGIENKAVALEVVMQSDKSTLTDTDIKEISDKIITSVLKNCAGVLRER
ncbi:MAG: phenylalanine--tRNA ligase subunit beta [Holosporales bacterium]|jgi:phenylalanyl-tRNA synthetase beta chain|nr:phenylalanine--tRNA ligase subunit beta [Holosporales bacterium]